MTSAFGSNSVELNPPLVGTRFIVSSTKNITTKDVKNTKNFYLPQRTQRVTQRTQKNSALCEKLCALCG